jgi:hypothetical protein
MAAATSKPAARKPAARKPPARKPTAKSAVGDAGAQLDQAADRIREFASELRSRADDEIHEFQSALDRAGEQLRVELGRRAIRAQGSPQALTQLSAEIRKRKAELTK